MQEPTQPKALGPDLIKILIWSIAILAILTGLTIWESNSGQISSFAHQLTELLVN